MEDQDATFRETTFIDGKYGEKKLLGQYTGVLRSYNEEKGFGFIKCDALKQAGFQNDVFVHHRYKGPECKVGDPVKFLAIVNARGQPQAQHVVPINCESRETQEVAQTQLAAAMLTGQLPPSSVSDAVLATLNARAQAQNLMPIGDMAAHFMHTPTVSNFFRGTIKSFSTKNNYGFIESDQIRALGYENDVFFKADQMGECTVGDEVFFDVCINSSGQPQTKGIVALAKKGPNHPPPGGCGGPCQNAALAAAKAGGLKAPLKNNPDGGFLIGDFVGEVKTFSTLKGYGFIACKELRDLGYSSDAFLHHTRASAVDIGDAVSFTAYLNDKEQLQARNVVLIGMGAKSRKRAGEESGVPVGIAKRAMMVQGGGQAGTQPGGMPGGGMPGGLPGLPAGLPTGIPGLPALAGMPSS